MQHMEASETVKVSSRTCIHVDGECESHYEIHCRSFFPTHHDLSPTDLVESILASWLHLSWQ